VLEQHHRRGDRLGLSAHEKLVSLW